MGIRNQPIQLEMRREFGWLLSITQEMRKWPMMSLGISKSLRMTYSSLRMTKEVMDLTAHLKRLLKISKLPYDNPHDIFNIKDFSNSSDDDNNGVTAMQVSSESDSEIKINPYGSKVKINELQGLGNPIESPSEKLCQNQTTH